MPVATPEQYAEMLDTAKAKGFAFPAINVSSSSTINSVLQGLTEAGSDGIIQLSTGGAEYISGPTIKDRVRGAIAFSSFGVLLYYVVANLSALRQPAAERRYPRAIAVTGVIGCLGLAATLPLVGVIGGGVVIAVGLAVRATRLGVTARRSDRLSGQ